MDPVPRVAPISEFRSDRNKMLKALSHKPTLLTKRGRPAAILLHPGSYDRVLARIEDLHLALDGLQARETGEPTIEAQDYLAKRGGHGPSPVDHPPSGV